MIGAGNVTRNCKGDHAVTARWGDTRALAGKRFNGLVKRIARTVGLILGLTLKFEFFVAAFDVVFQSLFESIKVVLKAVFDRSRRSRNGTERRNTKMASIAFVLPVISSNRGQPAWRPLLIVGATRSVMQIRLAIDGTGWPHRIGIEFRRSHLVSVARQQRDIGSDFISVLGYICTIDLCTRIGVKRLARRRLRLRLDA